MNGGLVICASCSRAVALGAAACPGCGAPFLVSRHSGLSYALWFALLGGSILWFFMGAGLLACGCGVLGAIALAILRGLGMLSEASTDRSAVRVATAADAARLGVDPSRFATRIPRTFPTFLVVVAAILAVGWLAMRPPPTAPTPTTDLSDAPGDRALDDERPPVAEEDGDMAANAEPAAPSGWHCACLTELDEASGLPLVVTACRREASECDRLASRASGSIGSLVGLERSCAAVGGDERPDLPIAPGASWQPSARAGGWQLRGSCVLE